MTSEYFNEIINDCNDMFTDLHTQIEKLPNFTDGINYGNGILSNSTQGERCILIGTDSGNNTTQENDVIIIGANSGNNSTLGKAGLVIGSDALNYTDQDANGIVIGYKSFLNTNANLKAIQGVGAIAIGHRTFASDDVETRPCTQMANAITIGHIAGATIQESGAIAIGSLCHKNTNGIQKKNTIAIGIRACGLIINETPEIVQNLDSIVIGYNACGGYGIGIESIVIGSNSNSVQTSPGELTDRCVIIGSSSHCKEYSTIIGASCSSSSNDVVIGNHCSIDNESHSVCIGSHCNSGWYSVVIGFFSHMNYSSGIKGIAIGSKIGSLNKDNVHGSIIGSKSALNGGKQLANAICIGSYNIMHTNAIQNTGGIILGSNNLHFNAVQGSNSIILGSSSFLNRANQNQNAICIGSNTMVNTTSSDPYLQDDYSIILGSWCGHETLSQILTYSVVIGSMNQSPQIGISCIQIGSLMRINNTNEANICIGSTNEGIQDTNCIQIGSGNYITQQNNSAISIGSSNEHALQDKYSLCLGSQCMLNGTQQYQSTLIGSNNGENSVQHEMSLCIGSRSLPPNSTQEHHCIRIASNAAFLPSIIQGHHSIAIGSNIISDQKPESIVLKAGGDFFEMPNNDGHENEGGFYITPIRRIKNRLQCQNPESLAWNPTTGEIVRINTSLSKTPDDISSNLIQPTTVYGQGRISGLVHCKKLTSRGMFSTDKVVIKQLPLYDSSQPNIKKLYRLGSNGQWVYK